MSESAASQPSLTSVMDSTDESEGHEPNAKKLKIEGESSTTSIHVDPPLEERLVGVLCCVVCLDIPNLTIYQCTNGHLMCSYCLEHLLADARIRDDNPATCPQCRCEIGRSSCVRVLAVEKAISELPSVCVHCQSVMPRTSLRHHEKNVCKRRIGRCGNNVLGCGWEGKMIDLTDHESNCEYNNFIGSELRENVVNRLKDTEERIKRNIDIINLFSFDKAAYVDIQLKPSRTDDYIPRLYYESSKFSLYNGQWVIKGKVIENAEAQSHSLSIQRNIAYQIVMKTRPSDRSIPSGPISAAFFAQRGPFGEVNIIPTKKKKVPTATLR